MASLAERQHNHNLSRLESNMDYISAPSPEELARDIGPCYPNGTRLIINEVPTETAANAQFLAESDIHYYSVTYFKRSVQANQQFAAFLNKTDDIRTTIPVYPIPATMIKRVDMVLDERVKHVKLPLGWDLKKTTPATNPIRRKTHMFATGYNVPLSVQGHGLKGTNGPYSTWTPKPAFPKPPDRLLEMTNIQIERNIKTHSCNVKISVDGRVPFIPIFVDISMKDAVKRVREFTDIAFRYHLQTMKYLDHHEKEQHLISEINRIFPVGPQSGPLAGPSTSKQDPSTRGRTMNRRCEKLSLSPSSSSSTSPDTGVSSLSSKSSSEETVAEVGGTSNQPEEEKKYLTLREKFSRLAFFCVIIIDDNWYWTAVCWRENTQMIKMIKPVLARTWRDEDDGKDVREWIEDELHRFCALSMAYNVELNQKIWDIWPRDVDILEKINPECLSEKFMREMRVEYNFKDKNGQPTVFDMSEDYVEKKKKGKGKEHGGLYHFDNDAFTDYEEFDDSDFSSVFLSDDDFEDEGEHTPLDSDDYV